MQQQANFWGMPPLHYQTVLSLLKSHSHEAPTLLNESHGWISILPRVKVWRVFRNLPCILGSLVWDPESSPTLAVSSCMCVLKEGQGCSCQLGSQRLPERLSMKLKPSVVESSRLFLPYEPAPKVSWACFSKPSTRPISLLCQLDLAVLGCWPWVRMRSGARQLAHIQSSASPMASLFVPAALSLGDGRL